MGGSEPCVGGQSLWYDAIPMEPRTTTAHESGSVVAAQENAGDGGAIVRKVRWVIPGCEDLAATVVDTGPGESDRVGTPLVFLHGLVGLNEHWESVVDRVKHRVRCVLFELPLLKLRGDHCSIQGATALTARFLGEYLQEPAVLVGNSFGGHVAVRMAVEHPGAVRGLVLAGASGLIEKSMVSDIQIRPSRAWLRRKISELFFDPSHMREADLDRAYAELSDRAGARAMVKLSRSARRDHVGDRMSHVAAPVLLIWGRQDVVTPPEAAEGFRQRLRDSRLVWFDRCGHAPMIEKPEEFAREVVEFGAALSPQGAGVR